MMIVKRLIEIFLNKLKRKNEELEKSYAYEKRIISNLYK